jgi:hypothetical protein
MPGLGLVAVLPLAPQSVPLPKPPLKSHRLPSNEPKPVSLLLRLKAALAANTSKLPSAVRLLAV